MRYALVPIDPGYARDPHGSWLEFRMSSFAPRLPKNFFMDSQDRSCTPSMVSTAANTTFNTAFDTAANTASTHDTTTSRVGG